MLLASHAFLLAFLPLAALAYHGLARVGRPRLALAAILAASLAFYASWEPVHLLVLLPLAAVNHAAVRRLAAGRASPAAARAIVVGAVALDLCALAWFKYAGFAADTAGALLGRELSVARVALPLGISFFTFDMITSVVDAAEGDVEETGLLEYAIFACFFPYIAAGPIVRHEEIVPQLRKGARPGAASVAVAVTFLAIGLAKKVLLADPLAPLASARFDAAAAGQALSAADAWAGALAYTVQIYFDFSGYSDMAIGAALLLGVRLPVNFASPYKAESVIDFWRRWHITLSRLLREYVFTPLALHAVRRGNPRPLRSLVITMLICGLWHGAGWTFVAWGALHGAYLAVNHAWRTLGKRLGVDPGRHRAGRAAAWLLTLAAVVVAWVFFRAPDFGTAGRVLAGMVGAGQAAPATFADAGLTLAAAGALLLLARIAPNTQQLTGYVGPGDAPAEELPGLRLRWSPSPAWAVVAGVLAAVSLASLSRVSEFIYFRF